MNSTSYCPVAGTIPFRVIEHLKKLPAGSEMSTPELLEALALEPSGPFRNYLETPIRHGLVKHVLKRFGSRTVAHWSLGDGVPPVRVRDEEPDADEVPTPAPATAAELMSAWKPARSVFDLGGPAPEPDEEPDDVPLTATHIEAAAAHALGAMASEPGPALDALFEALLPGPTNQPDEEDRAAYFASIGIEEEAQDEPFVCALWSDGRLQLQRGDTELALLSHEETQTLLHYLEKLACIEVSA